MQKNPLPTVKPAIKVQHEGRVVIDSKGKNIKGGKSKINVSTSENTVGQVYERKKNDV